MELDKMVAWMILSCISAIVSVKHSASLEACRPEDGLHRCSKTGKCRNRSDAAEAFCETGGFSCSNDEIRCRVTNRCIPRSLVGTKNGCQIDNKSIRLPCRVDEFTCLSSRICLPRYAVRDGKFDCHAEDVEDETDELNLLPSCNDNEFRCNDTSQRCIIREWVKDGSNDCPSGDDEREPLPNCRMDEHRCGGGRCVMRYRVHDGYSDCDDGSDEDSAFAECRDAAEFRCNDTGRCIPRSWMMDTIPNCGDQSDENVAPNYACASGEFLCINGRRCLPRKYLCDGIDHCADCSDEIEACEISHMLRFEANTSVCIPKFYGCGKFPDCFADQENSKYLPSTQCANNPQETNKHYYVIRASMMGDARHICEEKSKVCLQSSNFVYARCLSDDEVIAKRRLCDGAIDCRDLTDECLCNWHSGDMGDFCSSICYDSVPSKACRECSNGQLFCSGDSTCVDVKKVCDGVNDCPRSLLDEKLCANRTSSRKVKPPADFECWEQTIDSINLLRQLNITENHHLALVQRAVRCDGVFECGRFEDECNASCAIESELCFKFKLQQYHVKNITSTELFRSCDTFDLANGGIIFGKSICNGIQDCFDKSDEEGCSEEMKLDTEVNEPIGRVKTKITVNSGQACAGGNDSENNFALKNCSSSLPFYCTTKATFDAATDCANDPFSSSTEMIKSGFARGLIWIIAIVNIVGNGLVLHKEYKRWPKYNTKKRGSRALKMNVAIPSLGAGIALLTLICKSLTVSGRYCTESKHWRISASCNTLGVFFFMLNQVIIFSLFNLTCFRLHAYVFPFKGSNSRAELKFIACAGAWAVSIFFSIVPFMTRSMVTNALIGSSPYFSSRVVSWLDYRTFTQRIFTLVSRTNRQSDFASWVGVASALERSYKDVSPDIQGYFGYYGAHGICIPRLVQFSEVSPLPAFTVVILSINIATLIFGVSSSCVILFRLATKKVGGVKPKRLGDAAFRRQLMITTLVSANFCCWLPISIMAFASMGGIYILSSAYAAGTLLLPLTSSLNAAVFSAGFARERKALRENVFELTKTNSRSKDSPSQKNETQLNT